MHIFFFSIFHCTNNEHVGNEIPVGGGSWLSEYVMFSLSCCQTPKSTGVVLRERAPLDIKLAKFSVFKPSQPLSHLLIFTFYQPILVIEIRIMILNHMVKVGNLPNRLAFIWLKRLCMNKWFLFSEESQHKETEIFLPPYRWHTVLVGTSTTRRLWNVWSSSGRRNQTQSYKW